MPTLEVDAYAWKPLDRLDAWRGKNLTRVLLALDWPRIERLPEVAAVPSAFRVTCDWRTICSQDSRGSTVRHLGIEVDDALELSEQTEIRWRRRGWPPGHRAGVTPSRGSYVVHGRTRSPGQFRTLRRDSAPAAPDWPQSFRFGADPVPSGRPRRGSQPGGVAVRETGLMLSLIHI